MGNIIDDSLATMIFRHASQPESLMLLIKPFTLKSDQALQEAQLMLTNLRDAFGGQSKSPNIVPFHMLGIVFYCAIITLSLRRVVFTIFDFEKCRNLEIGVRGHSRSLKVVPFDRLCMVSY